MLLSTLIPGTEANAQGVTQAAAVGSVPQWQYPLSLSRFVNLRWEFVGGGPSFGRSNVDSIDHTGQVSHFRAMFPFPFRDSLNAWATSKSTPPAMHTRVLQPMLASPLTLHNRNYTDRTYLRAGGGLPFSMPAGIRALFGQGS